MASQQPVGPLLLNSEQVSALEELHQSLVQQLVLFKFNDPNNDQLLIRQHAAISGKEELVRQLLDLDGATAKQQQQKFDQLVDGNPQNNGE